MGDGMGFGLWGGGGMGMLLFWGVIIGLMVFVVRFFMNNSAAKEGDKTPLQTLKDRYARGEIGKEEFEQKKRDLEA